MGRSMFVQRSARFSRKSYLLNAPRTLLTRNAFPWAPSSALALSLRIAKEVHRFFTVTTDGAMKLCLTKSLNGSFPVRSAVKSNLRWCGRVRAARHVNRMFSSPTAHQDVSFHRDTRFDVVLFQYRYIQVLLSLAILTSASRACVASSAGTRIVSLRSACVAYHPTLVQAARLCCCARL